MFIYYKMNIRKKDFETGDLGEKYVLPILQEYWNVKLYKTASYFEFDFIDNNGRFYEVKTRNISHNIYPSTMVGYNKIEFANTLCKSVYFIFNFTDGVYYYKYNVRKLDELIIKLGGRCDRGKDEYKKYAYIPIYKLKKINLDKPPIPASCSVSEKNNEIEIYNV